MKQCPKCNRAYHDETLNFCLDDGEWLEDSPETAETIPFPHQGTLSEAPTRPVADAERSSGPAVERGSSASAYPLKRPLVFVMMGAVVLGLSAYLAYKYFVDGEQPAAIASIAVLPFKSQNTDPDTEYLADGLAESLIYRLSQLPTLRVSPTSTVFRYKGIETDPSKVGKDLDVDAVLSGRIVQRGDSLLISAELVDVRSNRLIWGERYDRKMSDLLFTQREMAREIVDKLRLKVSQDEKGLTKQYTENNEAYQHYLKGRFYWNKRTGDALQNAIENFNQAIALDPSFALAYAGLADCYVVPAIERAPHDVMPKAKAAALKALELDDSLAEAHTSLGRVYAAYEWNWAAAEREYKRAIELNPRYSVAHQWYGGYLSVMGRHDEAVAERRLAVDLDPLSLTINFELAQAYFYMGENEKAIDQYQRTLELDPNFGPALQFLPAAYGQKGEYGKAIELFKSSPMLNRGGEWAMTKAGLAYVYAVTGQTREALALIDELKTLSTTRYVPNSSIALIYAGLGENDLAFSYLEKAYQGHEFQLQWLVSEPRWNKLHSDPRFRNLLDRIGIPRETGAVEGLKSSAERKNKFPPHLKA